MRRTVRATLCSTTQALLVVLLVVLAACGGSAGQSTPPTATATARATPTTTPVATGTATPQPSPTGSVPILTGATLGGTRGGFAAVYGRPSAVGDVWNVHGLTFSLHMDTGMDGQDHAFAMLVYKSDATDWTLAQAQQACALFLPHDVTGQYRVTDADGNPEDVYMSALLAATFAPSAASYDPHGILAITYAMYNGGVFQCALHIFQ